MTPTRPGLVVHADWSVSAAKRWLCRAERAERGWTVSCLPAVAAPLLAGLGGVDGGAVLGVDAPIGLPVAFAGLLGGGAADFPAFLAGLTPDAAWFRVCVSLEEVCLARPFSPAGRGAQARREAHAARLGIGDHRALLRRCERRTPSRPQAAPMFWTLGANQVGKAALSFWREVLLPGLAGPSPPLLWPFGGTLQGLLASRPGAVVVAETYPAEALRQLGLPLRGSKRRRADRAGVGAAVLAAAAGLEATLVPALAEAVTDGFGDGATGEDRFDSLIGLLGLLQVLAEPARDVIPDDAALRWEGWIVGQACG